VLQMLTTIVAPYTNHTNFTIEEKFRNLMQLYNVMELYARDAKCRICRLQSWQKPWYVKFHHVRTNCLTTMFKTATIALSHAEQKSCVYWQIVSINL